ncbi:MAG: hypothetical protein AAGA09_02870 [Pseudomonadota bacterium]
MRLLLTGLLSCTLATQAGAEVTASAPDHYTLKHEGVSPLKPDALWARLIKPADWWHPEHTYSGDSKNLSLEAKAGGQWREDWDGGSVTHGVVLLVKEGETVRMDAPFGPLQEMGVSVIWTISLAPDDETGGTKVTFTEIANGTHASKLGDIAGAVDFVKGEAMARLTTGS